MRFFQRLLCRVADLTLLWKIAARVSVMANVSKWKLWMVAANLRLRYGEALLLMVIVSLLFVAIHVSLLLVGIHVGNFYPKLLKNKEQFGLKTFSVQITSKFFSLLTPRNFALFTIFLEFLSGFLKCQNTLVCEQTSYS